jgi:NADH-quinone oxidoreductase subunit D
MAETPTAPSQARAMPQDQRQPIDIVTRAEDLSGERMILNMGPSHPSTHGVLRIILELDGEQIVAATPDIGYLHRGMEKIAENFEYNKFVPYTDRFDYLSPMANNVAYTCAVERMLGIEIPPRAQAIRVVLSEMARISSHMLGIGCFAMDLGAMTVFLWTFTEREHLYDLFELISGARFTTSYTRVGGLSRDMPPEFAGKVRAWADHVTKTIDEVEVMLTRNRIWLDRTQGVGAISAEDAIGYGLTGANLRASGVEWDVRKNRPYLGYENYDFDVPVGTKGDCYDRYILRIEEMRQSVRILEQALDKMPDGPFCVEDGKISLPEKGSVLKSMEELIHQFMVVTEGSRGPAGEAWFSQENPKGELGFYVVGDGSGQAYRLRIRSPSFNSLGILPMLLPGCLVADTVAILGSFDFVMGECDR